MDGSAPKPTNTAVFGLEEQKKKMQQQQSSHLGMGDDADIAPEIRAKLQADEQARKAALEHGARAAVEAKESEEKRKKDLERSKSEREDKLKRERVRQFLISGRN